MQAANVFTIAPGAPFLKTFITALLDGRVVAGFSNTSGPLALAQATIYVPTRRSARALAEEFARATGHSSTVLPRILPLGALEDTETELLFEDARLGPSSELGFRQAAGEITRRFILADLILKWAGAVRHAIVSVDERGKYECDTRESFLVAATPADAWHLSGDLASLIDELIIEDVAWKKFDDPLVLPEFDPYWRITLDFLTIAIKEWPRILAERNLVDKARQQVAIIEAQSRRLQEGAAAGPVIAIGSTGSNRATARLLAAIARAPQGAVVLPGLDQDLDAGSWSLIAGDQNHDDGVSFSHPQAALRRLLGSLQVRRDEVISLGEVAPSLALRGRFVSEALRPSGATSEWIDFRQSVDPCALAAALEDISHIEARDEREEALAIAIAMREVLETPDRTAVLMTPDRKLARRTSAELRRWGTEVIDSAGKPLAASPRGVLARLAIACAVSEMAAPDLAAFLAHPLLRLGLPRAEMIRRAALLETAVLRSPCAAQPLAGRITHGAEALIAQARTEASSPFAHPAKQRISAKDWDSLLDLLLRLKDCFAPLFALQGAHRLERWVVAHRGMLDAIASTDDEGHAEEAERLDLLFDELEQNASRLIRFDAPSYARFFAAVMGEINVRSDERAHPRLQILGLLEARLLNADVLVLGGLDETVWPPQARTDAFLNRPMRAALGLTPPERKLGQTAHDFVQAMGKRKVILSRARKRDGAPAIASRFLQRMAALGGETWEACRTRGDSYLRLARTIDSTDIKLVPLSRPMPKPPVELRPKRLSVTQIETLRRDPYALYAEKILGLKALDPFGGPAGASVFGSVVHKALELFVKAHSFGPLPPDAREELSELFQTIGAVQVQDTDFAALKWPELERMIDFYLGFEADRRDRIQAIQAEQDGMLEIKLNDGSVFQLTARADRIELNRDGTVTLVDYKTGTLPGPKEICVGFAPQLTLEAVMCLKGAFNLERKPQSVEALYLKLGGASGGEVKSLAKLGTDRPFLEVAAKHYRDLEELLNQFRDPATPYPPRPFPKFAKRYNAYDHLARVKEWSLGGLSLEEGA